MTCQNLAPFNGSFKVERIKRGFAISYLFYLVGHGAYLWIHLLAATLLAIFNSFIFRIFRYTFVIFSPLEFVHLRFNPYDRSITGFRPDQGPYLALCISVRWLAAPFWFCSCGWEQWNTNIPKAAVNRLKRTSRQRSIRSHLVCTVRSTSSHLKLDTVWK